MRKGKKIPMYNIFGTLALLSHVVLKKYQQMNTPHITHGLNTNNDFIVSIINGILQLIIYLKVPYI